MKAGKRPGARPGLGGQGQGHHRIVVPVPVHANRVALRGEHPKVAPPQFTQNVWY